MVSKRKPTKQEIKEVADLITSLEKKEISYENYRDKLTECNAKLNYNSPTSKLLKAQTDEVFKLLKNEEDLFKYKELKTFDDYRLFLREIKKNNFFYGIDLAEKIGELTGYSELLLS